MWYQRIKRQKHELPPRIYDRDAELNRARNTWEPDLMELDRFGTGIPASMPNPE